jgi:hypothetical protein
MIMSTEAMLTNLELMRSDLEEFIADDNLDMLDDFTEKEIADVVFAIAAKLMVAEVVEYPVKSCGGLWNYRVKVRNYHKGLVSVSSEVLGITGVSRTEYKPFYFSEDEDGYYSGLCNLAQMINEAWYQCNS